MLRTQTRFAILLVLLFAAGSLSAQSSNPDGNAWAAWTPTFKLGFVSGYLQATDTAGAVSMAACMGALNYLDFTKVSGERWKDMCLNDKSYDYSGIAMGQFLDGTDAFYRDYRHKNLEVAFAFQYVRDQMRGKSQKDLDAEVASWQEVEQKVKK
jgi:hypothetical protein